MIEVKNLTKNYGTHTAVSDLSFTIEDGHIYGLLGPNGAGKSTTMNIMTGCLAATSGEVIIGGYDIFEEPKEAKKLIGYLPEIPPLYVEQTPREYLTFVAQAKGIKKDDLEDEIDKVVEETHIEDVENRLISHLSKGYRQRVGIAQALLANPEVIILDEPTVGLDPVQIIEIRDLIKKLGQSHTVILSSHILSEVQAICDEVIIIHKGKLIAFDKPENLEKAAIGGNRVEITAETSVAQIKKILSNVDHITDIEPVESRRKKSHVILKVDVDEPGEVCRDIFSAFMEAGKTLLQVTPIKMSLEDVFVDLTTNDDEEYEDDDEEEDDDE